MSEEEKGFVIKDRRIHSESEGRQEDKATDKGKGAQATSEEAAAEPKAGKADIKKDADRAEETLLPEVNFPTFIMSLNASALVHLGVIEDPATGQAEKNLPMAKQTIDIINMLEQKTRGNLTKDEAEILKNILYDLRIAYVRERQ